MRKEAEQSKVISILIVTGVILILAYLFLPSGDPSTSTNLEILDAHSPENSLATNPLPTPEGFPTDIPVEKSNIVDSNITLIEINNSRLLAVTYKSLESMEEKFAEYKAYLTQTGYKVTEESPGSEVKSISGTRPEANLSIVISGFTGETMVQISYLLKSL